jgi:hypothetical protein
MKKARQNPNHRVLPGLFICIWRIQSEPHSADNRSIVPPPMRPEFNAEGLNRDYALVTANSPKRVV